MGRPPGTSAGPRAPLRRTFLGLEREGLGWTLLVAAITLLLAVGLPIADSVIGRRPVYADDLVREIAPAARLEVSVVGSQVRPHFHGPTARAFDRRPRREHAIVCRPQRA